MTIDIDAWAKGERSRLETQVYNASERLRFLLGEIRRSISNPVALRPLLKEFERAEEAVNPELLLLTPFYEQLEVSWEEATHEELVTAAWLAFGGEP